MRQLIKIIFCMILICSVKLSLGYIPAQVKAFKESILDTTKVTDCTNCDFRGARLIGLQASGVHMPGVTCQPCIKTTANSKNKLMVCIEKRPADLSGINLSGANISSSCFDGANLTNANLSGADFSNGSASGTNFKDANLQGLISTNATFFNAIMPDGKICSAKLKTWTGDGVTINCNCQTPKSNSSSKSKNGK